jgi:alpha-beta hydrolase superfamily lysophospholipase
MGGPVAGRPRCSRISLRGGVCKPQPRSARLTSRCEERGGGDGTGLIRPSAFTLPLLILHGTADKVTKPSGSKEFYEKAGSKDKTLKLYEGHFHDLLADVGKQQVMADIQAWIDAHIGTEIPRSRRELRT